jgi:hypothetical protein
MTWMAGWMLITMGCGGGTSEDKCKDVRCDSPPANSCKDDSTLLVYSDQGSCDPQDGSCVYTPVEQDCPEVCGQGRCLQVDACEGVVCNQPPADRCEDEQTLIRYADTGDCLEDTGQCRYEYEQVSCSQGCRDGSCLQPEGALPRFPGRLNLALSLLPGEFAIDMVVLDTGLAVVAAGNEGEPSRLVLVERRGASVNQGESWTLAPGASRVWAVDLDGDDFGDLVVAGGCTPQVLRGSTGGLQPPEDLLPGVTATALAFDDVDADGDLDLAVLTSGGEVGLYASEAGEYQLRGSVDPGGPPMDRSPFDIIRLGPLTYAVSLAYFEPGSDIDMFDDLVLIRAQADCSAEVVQRLETDIIPVRLATGDVDADDHMDVVSVNFDGMSAQLFRGRADGLLEEGVRFWEGTPSPFHASMADIDGDGADEILVANSTGGDVAVFGYRDSALVQLAATRTHAVAAAVLALDAGDDGSHTLILLDAYSQTVSFLTGRTTASGIVYRDGTPLSSGAAAAPFDSGLFDTDSNGRPEFVVAHNSYGSALGLYFYEWDRGGAVLKMQMLEDLKTTAVHGAQLDSPMLLVASEQPALLHLLDMQGHQAGEPAGVDDLVMYLTAGDLDGDGKDEAVAVAWPESGHVLMAFALGEDGPQEIFRQQLDLAPNSLHPLQPADTDGDGRQEVLVAAGDGWAVMDHGPDGLVLGDMRTEPLIPENVWRLGRPDGTEVLVLTRFADGVVQAATLVSDAGGPRTLWTGTLAGSVGGSGDLDGDGADEILFNLPLAASEVDAQGVVLPPEVRSGAPEMLLEVYAADFDGDGVRDLLGCSSNTLYHMAEHGGFLVRGMASDSVCGNAVIEPGEDCEGADLGSRRCQDLGFPGGTLACDSICRFDTGGCEAPADPCGNGEIDLGEECDGANLAGQTCESLGFGEGTLACHDDCVFDIDDCDWGWGDCGDGQVDGFEECDGDNLNGQTCQDLGYTGGELACIEDFCWFDTDGCTGNPCGNGVIDAFEECDGDDLNGESCESLGFGGGTLACDSECYFDWYGCTD